MPQVSGFEVARLIIEDNPNTRIIFLTLYRDSVFVKKALEVGALGYVLKTRTAKQLSQAIRQVHEGIEFVSPEIKWLP